MPFLSYCVVCVSWEVVFVVLPSRIQINTQMICMHQLYTIGQKIICQTDYCVQYLGRISFF